MILDDLNRKKLIGAQMLIANEIKRVCDKYNLIYFLDAGSMLGAVRHKGCIPWDDDMDIGMPAEDYKKFLEVAPVEFGDKFFCDNYESNPEYSLVFSKVRLVGTVYAEAKSNLSAVHKEIFVDVFPYYYLSNNPFKRKVEGTAMLLMARLLQCKGSYKPWTGDGFRKRLKYLIFQVMSSCITKKKILKVIEFLFTKNSGTDYLGIQAGTDYDRWYFPTYIFEEYIDVPFENETFKIPKKYDEFLSRAYGDYMELPPEDQRGTNHMIQKLDFGPYESLLIE